MGVGSIVPDPNARPGTDAAGGNARRIYGQSLPTLRYWMETEVHVFGFSIAANVLLSFFPFLIVMVSLCKYWLHWPAAEQAVYLSLAELFPGDLGTFLQRNLRATVESRGPFQVMSIFLLLFTANGVFEPLEVALNKVWGIRKNRSFLRNQLVSLGLIFACGSLALVSITFSAMNQSWFASLIGQNSRLVTVAGVMFFKLVALPASMLVLFLVYWLLPNGRVPARKLLPVAIFVGLALEGLKYLTLLAWPWILAKFESEYGPFKFSVIIVFWNFLASMIILGGAEWTAREQGTRAEGE